MWDILVPEVLLQQAGVGTLVSERIAAGMPQLMRIAQAIRGYPPYSFGGGPVSGPGGGEDAPGGGGAGEF